MPNKTVATPHSSDRQPQEARPLSAWIANVSHTGNTTGYTLVEGEGLPGIVGGRLARQGSSHFPSSKEHAPGQQNVGKSSWDMAPVMLNGI